MTPATWYVDGDLVSSVACGPEGSQYRPSVHLHEMLARPLEAVRRGDAVLVDMITSEPLSLALLEDALRRLRGERRVLP